MSETLGRDAMTQSKGRAVMSSLAGNVAVFVLVTVALNGVIFGLGWDRSGAAAAMPGIPPGWVVGLLWVMLFVGMGVARWALLKADALRWVAELPSVLAFLCLLYPLYTAGLRDDRIGLIGNVVTAAVAVPIAAVAWRRSRVAGGCITAVVVWLLYAAAATGYGLSR
jgi:tryptophan-rich sensory protein